MALVLDYSAGKPGAAAIRNAGYVGAVRYIGFPSRPKCTDAAEYADFVRHGIGMAPVFQDGTGDWRGGYNAGRANALRARDHANAIGFPARRPIYMAIDADVVSEAEFRAVIEYIRGAADVLGGPHMTGPYGEYDVCRRVAAAGVGQWFWQCRAWSGTPVQLFPGRHLYQHVGLVTIAGIPCDVNDVLRQDWGQHTMEDDMPWSDTWTFTDPNTGRQVTARFDDMIGNLYQMLFYGSANEPWRGPSVVAHLKALADQQVADVDDDVLADAMASHGMNGATPAQVKAAMRQALADRCDDD